MFYRFEKPVVWIMTTVLCISCARHLPHEMQPGESRTRFSVCLSATDGAKSAYFNDDCMNRITDINVFLFSGGRLCPGCSIYTETCNPEVELPDPAGVYDLFFVANVGDVRAEIERGCSDVSDMEAWTWRIPGYPEIKDKGVPMSCHVQDWKRGDSTGILLRRLASRIDIRFRNSTEYDVKVKSMVLRQSVAVVRPFGSSFSADSADDMLPFDDYNDYLTTFDITRAGGGNTVHLYCMENMQGDLLPDNDKAENKNLDNIPQEKSPLVTYFEVSAKVCGEQMRWEDVKYRFCLGKDVTGNFDVPRNSILSYTLDFASTPHDTGWTIEPDDPIYSDDVGVELRTAEYYPGWDEFTFTEVSPENPVTVTVFGKTYTVDGVNASETEGGTGALQSDCVVVGRKMFVCREKKYEIYVSQGNRKEGTVAVNTDKIPLYLCMCADNERGETVIVENLRAGMDYQLHVNPYCPSQGVFLPWSAVAFPDELASLAGEATLRNYWNQCFSISMPFDEDEDFEDWEIGKSFSRGHMTDLTVYVEAPSYECTFGCRTTSRHHGLIAYPSRLSVFDPWKLPVSRVLATSVIDNSCGDLSNAAASSKYALAPSDAGTMWSAGAWKKAGCLCSHSHGSFAASPDVAKRRLDVMLDEYSCGPAYARVFFWDYDSAPSSVWQLPVDIYLDVSYVPKFGVLVNGGRIFESDFGGISVNSTKERTIVSGRSWGFQFMAARRDSYFRLNHDYGSEDRTYVMRTVADASPVIDLAGWKISGGYAASYNAGSILYNTETNGDADMMPNDGSVYFTDPVIMNYETWNLRYDGQARSPYYNYAFKNLPSMEKWRMEYCAETILDQVRRMNPVFSGNKASTAVTRYKAGDVYVNYRLKADTYLQALTGEWDRY